MFAWRSQVRTHADLSPIREAGGGALAQIDVNVDRDTRTITLTDNGAGMTLAIIN